MRPYHHKKNSRICFRLFFCHLSQSARHGRTLTAPVAVYQQLFGRTDAALVNAHFASGTGRTANMSFRAAETINALIHNSRRFAKLRIHCRAADLQTNVVKIFNIAHRLIPGRTRFRRKCQSQNTSRKQAKHARQHTSSFVSQFPSAPPSICPRHKPRFRRNPKSASEYMPCQTKPAAAPAK